MSDWMKPLRVESKEDLENKLEILDNQLRSGTLTKGSHQYMRNVLIEEYNEWAKKNKGA